jgi:hypothetical protein
MAQIKIDISELKTEGDEVIKKLADFLREKTEVDVETVSDEIIVGSGEKTVSKQYLRVLLRKFLHKNELKDYFRVISEKEDTLKVKERKISEKNSLFFRSFTFLSGKIFLNSKNVMPRHISAFVGAH